MRQLTNATRMEQSDRGFGAVVFAMVKRVLEILTEYDRTVQR